MNPCGTGKKQHATAVAAEDALREVRAMAKAGLGGHGDGHVYQCPGCGFWHVTSAPRRRTRRGGRSGGFRR